MAFATIPVTDMLSESKVVGVKLDISPDILPRDTSIGTKIFMLVPGEARNVREVKSYIGNFVLKTPSPFHIFMGDYRIRDEEDAKIFSIINEPCRLMPVPVPRSALSSTPKPKSSDKRVTFFDGDLSASPVQGSIVHPLDVTDHNQPGRNIHSPNEILGVAATVRMIAQSGTQIEEEEGELSDSTAERKKKRRRRHRHRKSKTRDEDLEENELNGSETSTVSAGALKSPETSQESQSSDLNKAHLDVLNEETESEEETTGGNSKDFDFITPVPVTNKLSRKRVELSDTRTGGKKKKLSDSAIDSSCSFTSPVASDDSRLGSGKVRQDTPNVPRSIRNPRFFDSARKIIDVFATEHHTHQNGFDGEMHSKTSTTSDTQICSEATNNATTRTEQSYKLLPSISCAADVNQGDQIAFKVLELDDRYTPTFSSYKEGIVSEKIGMKLKITYTKNNKVVRTGKYDLADDDSKDGSDQKEIVELHFSELVEPKFIAKVHDISFDCTAQLPNIDAMVDQQTEKNSSSPPASVI